MTILRMHGVFSGPGQFDQMMKQALAGEPASHPGAGCLRGVAEDVLISDCINSCRKRFLRLKSLLDVAETANACRGLDWDEPAVSPARATVIHRLIRYLSWRMMLSPLHPSSERGRFGREVNLSLILPYAAYGWYQVARKMKTYAAWKLQH